MKTNRAAKKELAAMTADVPGWMKLSKHGEAEMRRLAKDIAKTCEDMAKRQKDQQYEGVPHLALVKERELPPQVELTFISSDDDFAKLLGTAIMAISTKDQANLVVGEFIRRALTELANKLPKPPPQRCGNCRWFRRDLDSKRPIWGHCGAVESMQRQIPEAGTLTSCAMLHEGNGRQCPCHQYTIDDSGKAKK